MAEYNENIDNEESQPSAEQETEQEQELETEGEQAEGAETEAEKEEEKGKKEKPKKDKPKTGKPMDKTMIVHACAGFLFIGLCGLFFILGGGSESETAEAPQPNIDTIPDIMVEDVATNKLEAYKQAEALIEREQKEKELQKEHNSFDFFTKQLESPETIQEQNEILLSDEMAESEKAINELKETVEEKPQPAATKTATSTRKATTAPKKEEVDIEKLKEEEKRKRHEEINNIFASKDEEETVPQPKKNGKSSPFKPINKKAETGKKSITAVIHGEQRNVTSSSLVKLRTQEPFDINGTTIPRNTIIYGKAQISSNKVNINIDQIVYNNTPYPFKGRIYDLNGSEGLYIPDNDLNEGIKDAKGGAIEGTNVNINANNPVSLVSTGANALTNAVKRMASNKNKEVKVTLSANYKLIIVME